MYEHEDSQYCYRGTDVLINIPDLREQKQLDTYERLVTADRLRILALKPLKGKFDMKHLCDIHKFIFKDVYTFAGELREEDISKGNFRFAHIKFLNDQCHLLLTELNQEGLLKGLDKVSFMDRLTHYLTELNVLHPFREGNGRVQREFIRSLALECGYSINWANVEAEKILEAMIESPVNNRLLRQLMELLIEEAD
ncbi:cell filamentation protein Fic [Bacillus sp. FJAT-27264]|uniref:Fic/DOC family protein n=1 Tax=Paenibacillus sp. (strain DSM 101736 / FJAT-27264) TaxID=1850362 RepID=UPI000807D6C7|nr:Fic family protein [Bacillus sp. FJAT-27264]OBZ10746.1 cell filamentation protein Fic [Bacillus sp. FJAT-27264]